MSTFSLHDATWAREARRRRLVDRPPPKAWRFGIGDQVRIWDGGPQVATVRGRAEFVDEGDRYHVTYLRDGCVVYRCLTAAALTPVA